MLPEFLCCEFQQDITLAIHFTPFKNLSFSVRYTNLNKVFVNVQPYIPHHTQPPQMLDEWVARKHGPFGNYLFEFVTQPGGPRGGQLKKRVRDP
jgi:hypothetical protein